MTLDESKTEDDILDEDFGVSIITEKKIYAQLDGATVDYVESSYGGGFEIKSAQASGECGSGSSCGDSCGH